MKRSYRASRQSAGGAGSLSHEPGAGWLRAAHCLRSPTPCRLLQLVAGHSRLLRRSKSPMHHVRPMVLRSTRQGMPKMPTQRVRRLLRRTLVPPRTARGRIQGPRSSAGHELPSLWAGFRSGNAWHVRALLPIDVRGMQADPRVVTSVGLICPQGSYSPA